MNFALLTSINYLAVAVSTIIYFLLGSLWFSTLFGTMWAQELAQHNVIIKEPTAGDMMFKSLLTLITNFVTCLALACLISLTGISGIFSGFTFGLLSAVGVAATTLATTFVWESRSIKLFLLDIGYPMLGIIVSSVIFALWQ